MAVIAQLLVALYAAVWATNESSSSCARAMLLSDILKVAYFSNLFKISMYQIISSGPNFLLSFNYEVLKPVVQKELETKLVGIKSSQTFEESELQRKYRPFFIHDEIEDQAGKVVFSRSNVKLVAESRVGPRFSSSIGNIPISSTAVPSVITIS